MTPGVVKSGEACHAGGRGFESRRSRSESCLEIRVIPFAARPPVGAGNGCGQRSGKRFGLQTRRCWQSGAVPGFVLFVRLLPNGDHPGPMSRRPGRPSGDRAHPSGRRRWQCESAPRAADAVASMAAGRGCDRVSVVAITLTGKRCPAEWRAIARRRCDCQLRDVRPSKPVASEEPDARLLMGTPASAADPCRECVVPRRRGNCAGMVPPRFNDRGAQSRLDPVSPAAALPGSPLTAGDPRGPSAFVPCRPEPA